MGFDRKRWARRYTHLIAYVIMQLPGDLASARPLRFTTGLRLRVIGWSLVTMFQGTFYLYGGPLKIVLVILRPADGRDWKRLPFRRTVV